MLVFEERGRLEYPDNNHSEQSREPTTNSTHVWCRRWVLNPGHIGGRRVLSLLHHPLLPDDNNNDVDDEDDDDDDDEEEMTTALRRTMGIF